MTKNSSNSSTNEESLGNTKQDSPAVLWCFTLNNYSEKEYQDLISIFSSNSSKFIIGREIGESGTKHLQGFIKLKSKQRLTYLKKVNERAHWEKCKGSEQQNIDYCSKDGDYYTYNITIKKEIQVKTINNLLPFQKSIEDIILGPVNEGKIIWIYDPIGQTGKTQLLRYLNVKYKIPFAYGGKCADIINLAFNNKEYLESVDNPCFIYNFGRETQNDKISYNSMEQISDGAIANTKFEAGCFVFNQPHVIILSNCLPLMNKLTASRWIIKSINENKELIDYIAEPLEEII